MKTNLKIMIALGLLSVGCGLLKKKDDEKKDESEKVVSVAELNFELPKKGDAKIIDYKSAPAGEYRAVEVSSVYDAIGSEKYKSLFKHSFAKAGDPEENDPIARATDFSQIDASKKKYYPAIEINLPFTMSATGTAVSFKDKHYYWQQNKSDGGWGWLSTGEQSPDGEQFHAILTETGKGEDGIYSISDDTVEKLVMMTKEDDQTLVIYTQVKSKDLIKKFRVTYRK